MPLVLRDQFFGEVGGAGTGFDGGGNVGAKRSNDLENGVNIVRDGLIDENLPLLIHHANLNGLGVGVKTDENG